MSINIECLALCKTAFRKWITESTVWSARTSLHVIRMQETLYTAFLIKGDTITYAEPENQSLLLLSETGRVHRNAPGISAGAEIILV